MAVMVENGERRKWTGVGNERTEVEKGTAKRKRKGGAEPWKRGVERRGEERRSEWVDGGKRVRKDGGEAGQGGEAGSGTGSGSRERRKTKRRRRRRRWWQRRRRRRRPRYGGSVAFAGSRRGNEMPPSQLANPCRAPRASPRLPHLPSRFSAAVPWQSRWRGSKPRSIKFQLVFRLPTTSRARPIIIPIGAINASRRFFPIDTIENKRERERLAASRKPCIYRNRKKRSNKKRGGSRRGRP